MKHSEQLKGWAVDRATEIAKINGGKVTVESITADAQKLCDFCFDPATLAKLDEKESVE